MAGKHGVDEKAALRISSAFGGGINGMGRTCGAVTGALMVLGLYEGRTRAEDLYSKVQLKKRADSFLEAFHARFGSINCYELLDKAKEEDPGSDVYRNCPVYISEAVRLVQEILDDSAESG